MIDSTDAVTLLRQRGGEAALVDLIARSGLPGAAALRGVAAGAMVDRVRRWLKPSAPLSAGEHARLQAIAALAQVVLDSNPDAAGARRFWETPMPWLDGGTPADALAKRHGIGVIDDLLTRINYGIPP